MSFVIATTLEEQDTFCIRCHTVPETTYYDRARIGLENPDDAVPDLATAHYVLSRQHDEAAFACIQCHRGDSSLGDRVATLAIGARDALIYVSGRADPAIEKTVVAEPRLPDAACVGCHSETLLTLAELDNHFHTHLPQATRALSGGGELTVSAPFERRRDALLRTGLEPVDVAITCASCHRAHKAMTNGAASVFIDVSIRNEVCVACHRAAGEGPQFVEGLE